METKKNPKKDLNRNSQLYFALGLTSILALVYTALEWKTEYDKDDFICGLEMGYAITEVAPPLVILKTPPPPPPPVNPPTFDVVHDDYKGPETEVIIFDMEPDTNIDIHSLDYDEEEEDILIPIGAVEVVPVFPGCENETDKHACFNKMIKKHIRKNFRYPEIEQELGIQGRVSIIFEIQKDGNIGNVRMRGPNKNLEKEAARIIDKLPQMTPGKQGGKNVRVPFSIPITFKLQ